MHNEMAMLPMTLGYQ